jgi:hypothetical protein
MLDEGVAKQVRRREHRTGERYKRRNPAERNEQEHEHGEQRHDHEDEQPQNDGDGQKFDRGIHL